ncbi:MAG: hypothetical protein QOF63_4005, partial [Thermoanaerobaculia bacterium]|nr:hypothetical protein [Thermoanaerobaculia bacterium]
MQTLPGEAPLDELDLPPVDDDDVGGPEGGGAPPTRRRVWAEGTRWWVERSLDFVVVLAAMYFVVRQVGPSNLFANNTPTGGDMGAHVWGPAYLRDHLLRHGRITGWTPDWYAGFPAFQFYMVIPALAVVALNAGFHGWLALLPAAVAIALGGYGLLQPKHSWQRRVLVTAAVLIAVLGIGLPYGVAFKLVTVSGIVTVPLAAYAFGRLAGLPFPTPALLSLAS